MKSLLIIIAGILVFVGGVNAAIEPPSPQLSVTPVNVFRRLLQMSDSEREQFMAARSEQTQRYLRAKVGEFQALTPEARESRLQSLELRALLLPLMAMNETQRAAQIQMLPLDKRRIAEERLRTWSILPPPLAKDVLENEQAVRFFLDTQISTNREELLSSMTPQQRADLENKIARLNQLPEDRRQIAAVNVERFFGRDSRSREETLSALSEAERIVVTNTLARLARLAPDERTQAVEGLRKFKNLSPTEQRQFLLSAKRWQEMSEKDRQTWRELIARTHPTVLAPPPPMPTDARVRRISASE